MIDSSYSRTGIPRLGLTWGVWDMLHVGHVRLLQRAASRCETLFVGVTTDEFALERKGRRPVIPYEERCEMLLALPAVNSVFPQSASFTKADAVLSFGPEVLFVGSDWQPSTFDGARLGVPVVYLPRTVGVSSSGLREVECGALPEEEA